MVTIINLTSTTTIVVITIATMTITIVFCYDYDYDKVPGLLRLAGLIGISAPGDECRYFRGLGFGRS